MLIRETHRVQTKPGAYGFLAGLLVLMLGLVANASCAHSPAPKADVVEPTRTEAQRAEYAVQIFTSCGSGSGVLVDGKHVFTAFHVINCNDYPVIEFADTVVVRTPDGHSYVVAEMMGSGFEDIARLKLEDEVPNVVPVKIRPAAENEIICAETAVPERARRCGVVDAIGLPKRYGDVSVRDANYWFGNSGSGVYGRDGALVGIAVRLGWCSPGDAFIWQLTDERQRTCSGRVSSLTGSVVL